MYFTDSLVPLSLILMMEVLRAGLKAEAVEQICYGVA